MTSSASARRRKRSALSTFRPYRLANSKAAVRRGVRSMPFLIDAHDVGHRQTGNETWIRNVSRELAYLAAPGEVTFAASAEGAMEVRLLTDAEPVLVSERSIRRLAHELPAAMRKMHAEAALLQYTMPPFS